LSRGAELIAARDEKVEFARLCCNAGERALAASAFSTAAIYFLQGSAMLNETDWVANYDLILNLFTKCAYAQYVTGNHQGVQITLDPVLTNGRSLQDKFDAYCIMLNTLGAQGRQKDTLNFGLDILSSFGETFPRDPKPEDVMAEYVRLKGALAQRSIDGIKNAPALEDKSKVALMKLFVTINRYAFQANQNLMALIIFRAANVVLEGGVCREASVVFSSLGYIILVFGNASQGYEYAKLGLALLNRFRNREYCARVYCLAYGLVFPSAEPFQATIQKLKEGYQEGMRAGDVEWSMILADLYARTALLCGGGDIMSLAEEIRTFVKRMKELSHHMQAMTIPCLQTALNLMDASVEYPNVLSGEAMDEDVLLNKALENQRMNVVAIVYFFKMFLSYLFGEYNDAAEMAQKCQSLRKSRPFRGGNEAIETFYTGLVATEMIRRELDEDQRDFWREMAVQSLKSMENWASLCPWNFSAKLSIMKAEIAFTNNKFSAAAEAYRVAIELAREHRFVLEEALANERAGIFFSSSRGISFDTDAVDQHYLRAQTLYAAMGAIRKAKHVENARMVG
jgi:predicted ATPase